MIGIKQREIWMGYDKHFISNTLAASENPCMNFYVNALFLLGSFVFMRHSKTKNVLKSLWMKFLWRGGRKGSIVGKMYSYVESYPCTYQDWTCYVSSDCIQAEREGGWGWGVGGGDDLSAVETRKEVEVAEEFGVYVRIVPHNCGFQPSIIYFTFFDRLGLKQYLTNSSQRQHCDRS